MAAAARLLTSLGIELVGTAVLVGLAALGGRSRWDAAVPLEATLSY